MRINVAVPEPEVTKAVLDPALEAVTRLNEQLIRKGSVPTFRRSLARDHIQWKPEPPGAEHFDHAGVVQRRKWGDCDDLAPWHAASLRATGEDPNAIAVVRRSGPTRWHAYVERSDGTTDDPSREAGMGKRAEGIVGASLPLMFAPYESESIGGDDLGETIVRPAIAMRQTPRQDWQARVDLPWHVHQQRIVLPTEYAMATLNTDPAAAKALVGALEGACKLGLCAGYAHPDHVARIGAICDCLEGVPYEDIAACYGDEHAMAAHAFVEGSLWSSIKKGAKGAWRGVKKVAKTAAKVAPLAARVVQFVPGVGPLAREGIELAIELNRSTPKQAIPIFNKYFGRGGFPVV